MKAWAYSYLVLKSGSRRFLSRIPEGERGLPDCALVFEGDMNEFGHRVVFRGGSYDVQFTLDSGTPKQSILLTGSMNDPSI